MCVSIALAPAGCAGNLSVVDPGGPAAAEIATLWWIMLFASTAITIFVLGLIWLAFRRRHHAEDAAPGERTWIVGLGLVFPGIVLVALFGYGLVLGERLLPVAAPDVVDVRAEARQWAWSFGYEDAPGIVTENVLHIPAGRPVDVAITSADVVHSFWVPRLAGKLDAIPGHVNVLRIQAEEAGVFVGLTAEYNGVGYDDHVFEVIAHDEPGWAEFLAGTGE